MVWTECPYAPDACTIRPARPLGRPHEGPYEKSNGLYGARDGERFHGCVRTDCVQSTFVVLHSCPALRRMLTAWPAMHPHVEDSRRSSLSVHEPLVCRRVGQRLVHRGVMQEGIQGDMGLVAHQEANREPRAACSNHTRRGRLSAYVEEGDSGRTVCSAEEAGKSMW
jgi:hypothetical protein